MDILKLNPNVQENQIQVALAENEVFEQIPNNVNNLDIPADPVIPLHLEQPMVMEIDATEPAASNQEESQNAVNSQNNYRRSERIRLTRASEKAPASSDDRWDLSELEVDEPQNYQEAVQSKYAKQWMKAFEEEFKSQIENKTWELVPRSEIPPSSNIIVHKRIRKFKTGYDEVPNRFKGRLTAVGSRQRNGIDFDETFAPVPRYETVRATLSLMGTLYMDIIQIDIKTAFLNAVLVKPVYMTRPEGFIEPGKEDHVCRLIKALYGTKQAPRIWSKRLEEAIQKFGLKPISAYTCIFVRNIAGGMPVKFLLL